MAASLEDTLDGLLPQTQCTRCGYDGCRPYAEAMAAGLAGPDQCPPGGAGTVAALAALLGVGAGPVNPEYGAEAPPRVAVIDESICIGCAKCLPACPVDAIIGARRMLHTVVAGECNGSLACATCHMIVDPDWADRLDPVGEDEEAMLDTVFSLKPTSRLSCQIRLSPALDGITLNLPA